MTSRRAEEWFKSTHADNPLGPRVPGAVVRGQGRQTEASTTALTGGPRETGASVAEIAVSALCAFTVIEDRGHGRCGRSRARERSARRFR